ncbi:MAG: penicillin acylase family protein, partial [Chloroflexi bacterium]|nr:penicillin acylase family protein [Chloroflexota bacterium]
MNKTQRWLRRLGVIVGALGALIMVAAVAGYFWLFQRPQPVTDGTLTVAGISGAVEIIRDNFGVPHIFAPSRNDALFAQGYVHAQDRLWQMEFNRRVTSGRLSEVLGKPALDNDLLLRTLGFRRVAEQEWNQLDGDAKAALDAYTRGVNAFISTHLDNLPAEFVILGFKPEPWTPLDSVAWGKVMALSLGGNMSRELLRQQAIAKLGADKWNELEPGYPKEGPFIVGDGFATELSQNGQTPPTDGSPAVEVDPAARASRQALASLFDATRLLALGMNDGEASPEPVEVADPSTIFGSNNWVIGGARTTTGKPILANDPHLGIQMPSIWYEVHLKGGGLEVSGVSFPGVPGIVIGHNARIAWGFTNVGPDVQDLYIEKPNPANPKQFEFQGKWEDAQVYREEIKVKGAESVIREVLVTRHGPIVTGVGASAKSPEALALRWTALEPSQTSASILKLNEAQNWEQFRAAMKLFAVPAQNTVYADVDGNIGYQMPGWIPIRSQGDGAMSQPGWTGAYEWKGYIPFDDLPRVFNPPSGYIVTANNAVVPESYKYFISKEWAPPY